MKVYLAGRYSRRDELKSYAEELLCHGICVTSRWLNEDEPLNSQMGDHSPAFYRSTAAADLEDIDEASALVFFSEDPLKGTPRGGRHVEFGYALAKGKAMVVIGARENLFHFLPHVESFKSLEEFLNKYGHPATM